MGKSKGDILLIDNIRSIDILINNKGQRKRFRTPAFQFVLRLERLPPAHKVWNNPPQEVARCSLIIKNFTNSFNTVCS